MPNTPTLATLAADLDSGRTSARKLVDDCLARIADPQGEGARAFIHVDAEAAIEAAEAMDRLREVKAAPSPFAGIPVSIKDLFDIKGQVTRAGSRALEDSAPAEADAPVVGGGRPARGMVLGRHQSAFRHAEGRLAAQCRPCARRIVVGCRGVGRRRHGAWRARHRHRRIVPDSGRL
jgi:Asp-tRNA(Asn)/Glu-tRNA(Gln) amidotransferase A subunit family amidase